jgi:hypothetical protein
MSVIISANKAASPAFASTYGKQPPAAGIRLQQGVNPGRLGTAKDGDKFDQLPPHKACP